MRVTPIRKIILPAPNSVAASATSVISCPVGPAYRYSAIHLKIGLVSAVDGTAVAATALPTGSGTTAGYVNDIRLKVNGKQQRLHTAAQLAKLNGLNGSGYLPSTYGTVTGGGAAAKEYGQVITIWLAEPWRKSIGQQDALALPSRLLGNEGTIEVEVDFGALPTHAGSFKLSATAEVDGNEGSDIHSKGVVLSKVYRQNLTGGTAANSALDIVTLDKRDLYTTIVAELGDTAMPGTAANGITVNSSGAYAAKLVVRANSTDIHNVPKDVAALIHAGNGLNANQFDLEAVLDSNDDTRSGLSGGGLTDLSVRIDLEADTAASANWILITERTGPLD